MVVLTHASLFSGIGGFDLAAEVADFEIVCQCEWADYPYSVLEKHWPDIPKFRDITMFTKGTFSEKTGLETITTLSSGFPCQPFSTAGQRKGFADECYLWPEMCRVIAELRSVWVLGENAAGFIDMGFDKMIFDLAKAGYAVLPSVFPARGVGAWHECQRTFIAAANVSHTSCFRQEHEPGRAKPGCIPIGKRRVPQEEQERLHPEPAPACGGVLSDPGSVGWFPFHAETISLRPEQEEREPVGPGYRNGEPCGGRGGLGPGLGGMTDGLLPGMDGRILWGKGPEHIPRMTEETRNRAHRPKTLGSTVCPPQAFPIFRYIADIETGRCKNWCVFGKVGDEV